MVEEAAAHGVTRVFFLIKNRLVRETLVRLFHKRSDLCVVGDDATLERISALDRQCDILVLSDLRMLLRIRSRLPQARRPECPLGIVLIGMEEDEGQFLSAVKSRVSGYLLRDASANDVITAVRAVARGEAVCPPQLCLTLFREVARSFREGPLIALQSWTALRPN